MAYSKVERRMWNDDKFRRFPRDVRDMWQYLLTTEHSNRFGMFVLDPLYAAADLSASDDRWSEARVLAAWKVLEAEGRIAVDLDARLVLVVNHFKHNHPENPNVVKGALAELEEIPYSAALWTRFLESIHTHLRLDTEKGEPFCQPWVDAVIHRIGKESDNPSGNGPGKGFWKDMPNPEPEPEPEPEDRKDANASLSGSGKPNADRARRERDELTARRVQQVFEYWRRTCGHDRATLTKERKAKIRARLRTFSVEDLCRAVDAAAADPFYQGDNDRQTRYDWPETIFKSDASTERLMLKSQSNGPRAVVVHD